MNASRLLSVLLVLVALVVLVVALVFFFEKKKEESKKEEPGLTTTGAGFPVSVVTVNVVTYLKDKKVEELRANPDFFLLDARAKTNYQSKNVPVTVVSSELESLPGYTKHTHTLPKPFKADGLVFDGHTNYPFFPHPLEGFTAYLWNTTVLFLTFKTVNDGGAAAYYHFTANPSVEGLKWTSFQHDPNLVLDLGFLSPKLEELNTNLGNLVALNLDEFVDANTGTYTTEVGGVRTTFNLLKRPFTQTDYVKLSHRLLLPNTNVHRPFQLKKVLVSGTELTELVLPNRPVVTVSVFWWYNVPLLAELEFVAGNKEHFVYNPETNGWTNDVLDKVRTKLTVLKNKLGVPLTVDLSRAPLAVEENYTTNEVLVRVSPNSLTNNAFPSYTHRFSTGQPHFVGSFVNAGTPQSGLPSLRVNQLTVFFSNGVPLVLDFDLAGVGSLGTRHLFYSNNGFGFWSKFPLTQEFSTPEAVLNKLDTENKKLVAENDKYVLDVFSKSDYLSVGKPLKVAEAPKDDTLKDYTAYTHKAKGDAPFKFEKFTVSGNDVKVTGLEELTGVNSATVYWFLDSPLFVKLEGTKTVPVEQSPASPANQTTGESAPGSTQQQGQPAGGNTQPPTPGSTGQAGPAGQQQPSAPQEQQQSPASSPNGTSGNAGNASSGASAAPVSTATRTTPFTHHFSFNAEEKVWAHVTVADGQLKTALDKARATFGAATVNVGHGVGTYETGPVTVTVSVLKPHESDTLAALDVMVHEFSTPFLLGKLKHFDFDLNLTHTVNVPASDTPAENGSSPSQKVQKVVPFQLEGFVVKKVDVFVFKYVPLLFKLYVDGGQNLVFTNNFTQSTWHKFVETGDKTLRTKLLELKSELTTTTSLDVCKDLKSNESVTYELPKTFGTGKVSVTLTRAQDAPNGLKGLTHTLAAKDVKLASLTCGDKVLTGLNLDQVEKVSVFLKGDSVALVKTNSDPKFFVATGEGTLSHHTLPQGVTDLNPPELGQLLNQTSNNLGPVLALNLEAKETYPSGANTFVVDHQHLGEDWNLFAHHLARVQQPPPPPPTSGAAGPNGPPPPQNPVQPHFTVSKFFQGPNVLAVGLPLNKSYTDAFVVLKSNVPYLLGLKTHVKGDFEWFVFNKFRWLADFTTTDMLHNDDLLAFAKEVAQGLDNEFDLDLSTDLQNEAFLLEQHEFAAADELDGFTFQTYTPLDNKYPFLLKTLTFNSTLLSVPFLQSHHLNGFALYLLHEEPVFLHAYTLDNKFLFFENGFEGEWKKVENLEEFTKETLKNKLNELRRRAVKFVTLNLNNWSLYRNFGDKVHVQKVTEGTDSWAPFHKWEHKFTLTPSTEPASAENAFKVSKVLFNGVDLKLPLPKGAVTSAAVFATEDQVPLALYLRSTGPPKAPAQQTPPPPPAAPPAPEAQRPAQAPAQAPAPVQNVVTHNYFFNKADNWQKSELNAELDSQQLKQKLQEALTSLGFYVEMDLAQKLPYLHAKTVHGTDGPKVVDFLVQFNPKDTFNFSTYTHVPQVRAVTQGSLKTADVSPLVTYFTLNGQRLRGFDLNKVMKLTVYWWHDKFPLLVHVVTPLQHKLFRNAGDNNWNLLKTHLEPPTNSDLFRSLALAKQSFTLETNVELGATEFKGSWHKYKDGQVTLKVTKLSNTTLFYNVFTHTSVTVGFPTFFLGDLKLWGRPVYGGLGLLFVREVKVFTDMNNLPLLVEVVSSKSNAHSSLLQYTYLTFDKDAYSGWFLKLKRQDAVRLNNDSVVELMKEVKDPLTNVEAFLQLDAKADYNTLRNLTVKVGTEQPVTENNKFKSHLHTFEAKLYFLLQNGYRVGFDYRPTKFSSANVFWLGGVPVYAKFKHANQDAHSHYFHWPNGTWNSTLPFTSNFNPEKLVEVLNHVHELHDQFYTLDLGTKTVTSAFGDKFELDLVEYKHANVTLPEELVGYSLLPASHKVFKLTALKVFGLDFNDFQLPLPGGRVLHAHVYSPDAFYAPLFLELVSVEPVESLLADPKLRYDYFHATQSGNWTFLDTDGLKLDPAHMGFKLAAFTNPVPALVNLGKREGTYGLNELTVTKVALDEALSFTKYVHKFASSETFLTAKWLYNGLLLLNLPTLKATSVAVYFYQDVVPLLLEVNSMGSVKFFATDFDGNWAPDLVSKNSVFSYLNYLVHDLNLLAKVYDSWVPQLNFKLLREFELVPPEPPQVEETLTQTPGSQSSPPSEAPVTPKAPETPAETPPAGSAGKSAPAQQQGQPAKPTGGTETPPTAPATPVSKSADGPADLSTRTTVAESPNLAKTVAPATAAEENRVVTTVTTGERSAASRVEEVGVLATETRQTVNRTETPPGGPGGPPPDSAPAEAPSPGPGQQGQQLPQESPTKVLTTQQVPAVKPSLGVENLFGAKSGVVPLVPPVTKVEKPKRKFRLSPLDYDKLFNGYLTLGKLVGVTRFETVPVGYRFARHALLDKGAKHLTEKFFVGDKLYSLPADYLATPAKDRKLNSVGFYSHLNDPLLLKLAFETKKPEFFAFNRHDDSWKKHNVVNLEEELENLNHDFHGVFVFDLGKKPGVHHPYFNDTAYFVSGEDSLEPNLFNVQEFEAFDKVPKANSNDRQLYTQLPFRLGKLRHNAVDLPVDGLPLGTLFYTMRVHFSRALNKPLVLVLYPDQDEKDRKRFERENPGKYLGFHYHLNADNTWTFFVPEGVNALLNKLKELEALFKEPPALDLAKVTGTTNLLEYWTEHEHLVVEKLFLSPPPAPEAPRQAQAPPVPGVPGQLPPPPPPQDSSGPPAPPGTSGVTPPGSPDSPPAEAPVPTQQSPTAPVKVDPLVGLEMKTGTLPADVVFTEVPLVHYTPVAGLLPTVGFEWFHHHTPFFVQDVPTAPQEQQQSQESNNSLKGAPGEGGKGGAAESAPEKPKTKRVVKVKRFHLGKVLNLGVPLNFELPFERSAHGFAGLTVLYEKNFHTPFLFALFNPKENSSDLPKAFYDVWVFKNMKWVKTAELEEFFPLFRAFELRHELEQFNALVPKLYAKLTELSNQAKAPQTHLFTVDLGQADTVTQGDVVVHKDGDHVDSVDLFKTTFTPKLTAPRAGWVDFTLEKVTLFGSGFVGLDLPLVGVSEVNVFFRNNPDKFAKFPVVLEFVQKLLKDGKSVLKHLYYVYEDGNTWKLHMTTFNKLADHEVFDLVNAKLFEYYRRSLLHENALMLDLDTKFSHLSLGRFVDAVDFVHDPSPRAPYSPVPEGFVLYRHSMVTENSLFFLPFMKLNGVVTSTSFLWPFVQYFVYYKVGDKTPFVVVLAKAKNLQEQPTHQWYYVKGKTLVRFLFEGKTDVDPDAKDVKDVVAKKFAELLKTPPRVLTEQDPWTVAHKDGDVVPPTFPATDNRVLSNPVHGVPVVQEAPKATTTESGTEGNAEEAKRAAEAEAASKKQRHDLRFSHDTGEWSKFLAHPKRDL